LLLTGCPQHRALHSFPTRRSSDLDGGLQRDEGSQRVAHYVGLAKLQMADQSGNVVAHRFTAQWPVGVWRAPMRLEMDGDHLPALDRKSTRLNSSHRTISYAVFCLK